jgi:hypothetical protein
MVALAAIVTAAPAAQDRGVGGIGITVFADPNYRGENASFDREVRDLGEYRLANRISSLRVAPGEYWEVCEYPNFRGQCQVFYDTESDLRRVRWDNRISSMRRVRGGGSGGGGGRGGSGDAPRDGIVLYGEAGFRGSSKVFRSAEPNLVLVGFNDVARSLRLGGRPWEICRDADYVRCEIVYEDVADLNQVGLGRRVSSLRPASGGGGGRGEVGRLELFEKTRYGGDSIALEWEGRSLGKLSGRAESLRLSGTWEICDAENFRGRCIRISRNIDDLASIGWKDRIQSARPR